MTLSPLTTARDDARPSPQPFNMAAYCLRASAAATPGKPALVVMADAAATAPSEIWSFAEVEDAVLRIAEALAERGLARGDRVMIRLDNTSAYALLFFGAIAGGFVPLPVSSQLTAAEAAFLLADSGAQLLALDDRLPMDAAPAGVLLMTTAEAAVALRHPRRAGYAVTMPDDPAFLIYTSGTTARPKGVMHAQRSAFGRRPMYQGWYGITPADRVLHAGAFNWTFTLGTGLTDPWANGATAIVYTGPRDPEVWPRLVAATGATLFAAVPGLCRQLIKYARPGLTRMPSLRHGLIAGETPPPDLFEAWRDTTATDLHEALGMSEISTYVSSSPSVPRRPGTIGKPQPGRRVAILDQHGGTDPLPAGAEGLLAVHRSDPGLMLGYWNRPAENAEVFRGDWFTGGDLATLGSDGYVTHLGRANDVMNAMGYRVSPQEVEAALMAHPG
ncbi:MAG: AMP-binding protein, partial [Hyphomicrobium sp.]